MSVFDLLKPQIQEFIVDHTEDDFTRLALSKNPFPNIQWQLVLNQIAGRAKAKKKLPTWFACDNILYPAMISIEQSSSEITAEYKSDIVSGDRLIDLSSGFGVDVYYFAKKVAEVFHCELNKELSDIVKNNFLQLSVINVNCLVGDSQIQLAAIDGAFNWIYIDPSRRNESKGKVFQLRDCLPNVPENLEFYFSRTNAILIKTAPLLDIAAGISELSNVKSIHIVAVKNEVKELLWELEKNYTGEILIKTINYGGVVEKFDFVFQFSAEVNFALPMKFLFEPNAAIMKSGGFNEICIKYQVDKLHPNSHLYTSDTVIDFPGRIFEIESIVGFDKIGIAKLNSLKKANVTTRNFPDSVATIRKKFKISDGGNTYCFFTTDKNDCKIVLICTKIK